MRAQVSIELLTTLGMVLAFSLPVLLLLLTITQYGHENAGIMQADASARVLANNIDLIYFQGDGAKKTIVMNFPISTKSIEIKKDSHEIVLNITTSSGYYEVATPFYGNLEQDFSETNFGGLMTFELENKEGQVLVKVIR